MKSNSASANTLPLTHGSIEDADSVRYGEGEGKTKWPQRFSDFEAAQHRQGDNREPQW